jgi:hypothetical protein
VLIECHECKSQVSDSAASCPHCGALPAGSRRSVSVTVADMDMKLVTIFFFLLKVAIAAFPVLMIMYTALTVLSGFLNPLLR